MLICMIKNESQDTLVSLVGLSSCSCFRNISLSGMYVRKWNESTVSINAGLITWFRFIQLDTLRLEVMLCNMNKSRISSTMYLLLWYCRVCLIKESRTNRSFGSVSYRRTCIFCILHWAATVEKSVWKERGIGKQNLLFRLFEKAENGDGSLYIWNWHSMRRKNISNYRSCDVVEHVPYT